MDSIDVFCEKGVFDQKSTVKILKAGIQAGMAGNFHGDELTSMKSGEVAAEVGARCVSHLEKVTTSDMDLMSTNGVIGVLLPTTAYILRLTPPPARDMISKGNSTSSELCCELTSCPTRTVEREQVLTQLHVCNEFDALEWTCKRWPVKLLSHFSTAPIHLCFSDVMYTSVL